MGQSKNIKRSLILTALTAVMSVALFLGSTFAWVSDSLTGSRILITGGSLDAKLEYRPAVVNGADYAQVAGLVSILKDTSVWVPGHVEAYNLRISNVGSIAFLYQLQIGIAEETAGVNPEGQPIRLSELVQCFILDGRQEFASGAEAIAAGTPTSLAEAILTVQGELQRAGTREVTLVLWMPDSLGAEVNYLSGTDDPRLRLGVTLTATQLAAETNSSEGVEDTADTP